MRTFLRKNLMIVVSIALPLLVVLFFALASVLPGLFSAPPAYDLLLTLRGSGTAKTALVKINLVVVDGQVRAVTGELNKFDYYQYPRLFRYDHVTGEVREINIPVPANVTELEEGSQIPIAELEGLSVSEKLVAPDGYEFSGRGRGGGFITEFFGGSRHRNDVRISKNGAVVRIRLPITDYWYNEPGFVGWILNAEQ